MTAGSLRLAPPVSDESIEAIRQGFSRLLGEEVSFDVIFDKALLGGFEARINGVVYDATLAGRLAQAQAFLKDQAKDL